MIRAHPHSQELVEYLPSDTQRYDNTSSTAASATVIPSGLVNSKSFLAFMEPEVPQGWKIYYNPAEGRPYYSNPDLRVLTESNITKRHVLNRVVQWSEVVLSLLQESNRSAGDCDVVLKVSENEGNEIGTCRYYLVDYASEVVFWIRETHTTSLGLPDVRSANHLKLLLSEQFWVHCEYMPPPHWDFRQNAKDLLATLGTLSIDASSSTGSISPFHQDECEAYSRALSQVLSNGGPTEVNWCLARLRSLITQSRIINLFGEHNARTDRNVVVNGQNAPPKTHTFELWSVIMFGIPSLYLSRWNAIWVDRVTYTREWKKLTKETTEELLYGLMASSVMTIASITLLGLASSIGVRMLASISLLLGIGSGIYAASLFATFRALGGCAADAANYIQTNEHAITGLQGIALKHGVPWALIIWSGLCLFIAGSWELLKEIIELLYPVITFGWKDIVIPALVAIAYFYGRGFISFGKLYDICRR